MKSLERDHPESHVALAWIRQLDETVRHIALEPFFEPVSATVRAKGKQQLLAVGANELNAWLQHIGQGTYCRLRALEGPLFRSLSAGHPLAGMTLLRAHLEAAALSAYCLEQLRDSLRSRNMELIAELIPKTLFGTSMQKHLEQPAIADLLPLFEGDTIRICRAIEALDRFYYQEGAEGQLLIAYSLLCEFAHPNHRGVMHMMSAADRPDGWEITYGVEEHPEATVVSKALEILLVTMRAGYAASQLLRCWRFEEQAGDLIPFGPRRVDADRIWRDLLQRPAGTA